MADFEDRSGIVYCSTDWGRWSQTVSDVNIEVDLQQGTKGREVKVDIRPSRISCTVRGSTVFQGKLFEKVIEDDSTWTLEDAKLLRILLSKVRKDDYWSSLLESGGYQPEPATLLQMRQKLDLERYELENPGFDFSSARLDKQYEDMDPAHQLGAASLPASLSAGNNMTDDEKLMETGLQDLDITAAAVQLNPATRTDDMKTEPLQSVVSQPTAAVHSPPAAAVRASEPEELAAVDRTDDMKTNPSAAETSAMPLPLLQPIVTDDMKTEENESLETDEEKSGV